MQSDLAKKPGDLEIIDKINGINCELQRSYRDQGIKSEETAANKIKDDPAFFFKYVNSKRTAKTRLGPLKSTKQGKPFYESDPEKMAEILSNQYKSVFTAPIPEKQIPDIKAFMSNPAQRSLADFIFTVTDIEMALGKLKPGAACGPDGWPAFLLHKYRKSLAMPIYHIWRTSLNTGDMPEEINMAVITPIFKGGLRCAAANYRPIALTSHLTKTFERVMRDRIIEHLARENFLNPKQHGFRSQRSTLTQLIQYYTKILDLLEEHGTVRGVCS